ncbi:uncharacterized protein FMAN_15274 [Fusarium mangiferae]|uniref:Transmembrane protein n=1 Tax=Fusarium mangiferae TaxID=192010 RepID=A0A1L7UHX3_FUSMA|nr:uncharacterized protein FMAN_15274 [Fusarium mangiferae]CVL07121.1 uncharacterized protein FMAN_15274 [Fusarium mangiferae]
MEHLTEDMIWEPKEYVPLMSIYPFGQIVQAGINNAAALDPRYTVTPIIGIALLWYHYNWYWNLRAKWTIPVGVIFSFCSAQIMLVVCGFPFFMDMLISAVIILLACGLLACLVVVVLVIVGLLWCLMKGGSFFGHIWSASLMMAGTAVGCAASAADSFADNLDQWHVYVLAKVIEVVHSVRLYLNSTPHSPTGRLREGPRDDPRDNPRRRPRYRYEDESEDEPEDSQDESEDDRVRDPGYNPRNDPDYKPDHRPIEQTDPYPRRSPRTQRPREPQEFRHYSV